jgi:hypothetical protein
VLWSLLHGLAMLLVDQQLPARVASMPVDMVVEHATGLLLERLGTAPAAAPVRVARAAPRSRRRR